MYGAIGVIGAAGVYGTTISPYYIQSYDFTTEEANPFDAVFGDSGSKLYMVGTTSDTIYEYDLTTPYDIGTGSMSYTSKSFPVSQDVGPQSINMSDDGTKAFIFGGGTLKVFEYELDTPWDISTAFYSGSNIAVDAQDNSIRAVSINNAGNKLYALGTNNEVIVEFNFGTAYDITTLSFVATGSVASESLNGFDVSFNNDGTKCYVIDVSTKDLFEYELSTAWDITTISYTGRLFNVSDQDTNCYGVTWNNDGSKFYMVGSVSNSIHEYICPNPFTL